MLDVETPSSFYPGLDGTPLQYGQVYFGVSGQNPVTNPVTVYWDPGGTQIAVQPIKVVGGQATNNGVPARVWTSGDYSRLVRDSLGRQVKYELSQPLTFGRLSTSAGSTYVNNLQNGAGAQSRVLQDKLGEWVSVMDFMTSTQISDVRAHTLLQDVTAAIKAAAASLGSGGGTLIFPPGFYGVSDIDSIGACLQFQYPIHLMGFGPFYTAIVPLAAVSSGTHTLQFSPSTSFNEHVTTVEGLCLGNPNNSTRLGNAGVYCSTLLTGQILPKFTLRGCYICQGSGPGFYHQNSALNNPGGAMYGAVIENNIIQGGCRFDSTGDSNNVVRNILSGTGIGVFASLVTGVNGASSLLVIDANNITTTQGAIRLLNGSRFCITRNNIEHNTAGAAVNNDSSVISIPGTAATIYGGVIRENLISAFGATDATTLVRLDNLRGTELQSNVLLSGSATTVNGFDIHGSCQDVRVGPNTYDAGVTNKVVDAGVGTMGVLNTAALQNAWVAFAAGTSSLKYLKTVDGLVHVSGAIKSGATANNTVLCVLPAGFRPFETIRAQGIFLNAGVPAPCEVNVDTAGNATINYVTSNVQLNVNITFPAANLANGTSLE